MFSIDHHLKIMVIFQRIGNVECSILNTQFWKMVSIIVKVTKPTKFALIQFVDFGKSLWAKDQLIENLMGWKFYQQKKYFKNNKIK
jgi:hypothetical protein